MKGGDLELDAQRARWEHRRSDLLLVRPAGEDFARGGLARHAEPIDLRILVLPSDPNADSAVLDDTAMAWLKTDGRSPYSGAPIKWGHWSRGTNDALVVFDRYRDDAGWAKYLALHRHGGIEAGASHYSSNFRGGKAFLLRAIVGAAWSVLALQVEAIERWQPRGPFELTVALRGTKDATLAGVAEGWAEPGFGDYATCLDEHIVLRRELDELTDVEDIALDLGGRIELAFGTIMRRHIARSGEYKGRFDPRF